MQYSSETQEAEMTDEQMIESERIQQLEAEQAEQFLDSNDEYDAEYEKQQEDLFNGRDAGQVFADRHILDKISLFVKVYREKKYSDSFIEGFVDGINERIGANIYLDNSEAQGEETDSDPVDSQQ